MRFDVLDFRHDLLQEVRFDDEGAHLLLFSVSLFLAMLKHSMKPSVHAGSMPFGRSPEALRVPNDISFLGVQNLPPCRGIAQFREPSRPICLDELSGGRLINT